MQNKSTYIFVQIGSSPLVADWLVSRSVGEIIIIIILKFI